MDYLYIYLVNYLYRAKINYRFSKTACNFGNLDKIKIVQKSVQKMNSIVHYEKQASSTTSVRLSEGNIERILGANTKRTKIGGTHGHDEQC